MIEAGVLDEDDRVEFLEGWLVPKMVHNPRHDVTIQRLMVALLKRLPAEWTVRIQSAITTPDSEPEPDLVVVPSLLSRFDDRHPGPEEIALVIEVADSSLERDRDIKLRLYARAKIPVYWIVNVRQNVIETYSDPTGPAASPTYRQSRPFRSGEVVPLMLGSTAADAIAALETLGR